MEHEDTGNEEQGHDQNWHWANLTMIHIMFTILLRSNCCNLDARAVIGVESPHATTAGAASSNSWGLRRAWQVSLREYCYVIPSGPP